MMKLKINKTYIKESRTKIKNQNIKDWGWNTSNKENKAILFEGWEKK